MDDYDYNPEVIVAYAAFLVGGFLMGLIAAWIIAYFN
jgi:hypothetical protein